MPGEGPVDWYWLTLVVGTAVVAFGLGSASTAWWFIGTPQIAASTQLLAPATHAGAVLPSARLDPASRPVPSAAAAANRGQAPVAKVSATGQTVPATAPAAGQPANAPQGAGPAVPAAAQGGNFSLQLGAFLDGGNAKLLFGRLASKGYAPVSVDAPDGYGHVWHYVRLGAFADEQAASVAASEILERTGIAAVIVRGSATSAGG